MRRVILLIIMAFIISAGTVGILYQEGIGGVERAQSNVPVVESSDEPIEIPEIPDTSAVTEETETEEPAEAVVEEPAVEEEVTEEETDASVEEETEDTEATDDAATEETEPTAVNSADKEAGAPYYSLTLKKGSGHLNMHSTASETDDVLGLVAEDATGYLIDETSGKRRLVYIDGKVVYISKLYSEVHEIATDEYPDALVELTAEDAGKEISLE